jgi:Uma2 family endonuclease
MTAPARLLDLERALAALPETLVGEILFGRLVTQPRPALRHAMATSALGELLGPPFSHDGPGGWIILDEPEVQLGPHVVVPDLAGWRRETLPTLPDAARMTIAPDWVCEVLSPSTESYDREDKKLIYAANDVPHLWLVDVATETIEAYRSDRGKWFDLGHFRALDEARIDPFEGVPLAMSRLWRR